jgi:hypothetical protein
LITWGILSKTEDFVEVNFAFESVVCSKKLAPVCINKA